MSLVSKVGCQAWFCEQLFLVSKQTVQHLRKAASKLELQWVLFAPGPGSPLLFLVVVTDLQVWMGCSPVSLISFITSAPDSAS